MKTCLAIICFSVLSLASCSQSTKTLTYKNSDELCRRLIEASVKATLQLDPGLNTGTYWIDLKSVGGLSRKGIEDFLRSDRAATEAGRDSLILHDPTWIKYEFFDQPILVINTIAEQPDGTLLISTTKLKASDGAIGTKIILRRKGDGYECVSKEITWIS